METVDQKVKNTGSEARQADFEPHFLSLLALSL